VSAPERVTTDATLAEDLAASVAETTGAARPMSLISKLAAVMATVERVPKRGKNEFHGYAYATEADIADLIRKELATRRVMLIPEVLGQEREKVGEKGSVLTTLKMRFTFYDAESGEKIVKQWMGAGTDKDDKGLYKAMTGAEKYFLLKTFLIPTGDDPEREDKRQRAEDGDAKTVRAPRGKQATLPDGTARILKVVPKSKGAVSWADVTFVKSTGEEHTAPIQADPRGSGLNAVEQLCQENAVVEITTEKNGKGNTVISEVRRYRPEAMTPSELPAKTNGAAGAF
jgi:hypothetical protein